MKYAICIWIISLVSALDAQRVIFYHIPKTAGCSTRYLLERHFDCDKIATEVTYYEIEAQRLCDLEQYDFFGGHFFYNSNLKHLEAKRITFLRDPIQRVLSEQRFSDQFYHTIQQKKWLAISHYYPPGNPIDTISNVQVLYLSSYDRNNLDIPIEMHYESAKKNLQEAFDFVGIVEDYESSIRSLYDFMGWHQLELIPKLRSSDLELTIDDTTLTKIKNNNHYDILLYEEAKRLFYAKHKVSDIKSKPPFQFFSQLFLDLKKADYLEGFTSPVERHSKLFRPLVSLGRGLLKVPLCENLDYKIIIETNREFLPQDFKIFCQNKELHFKSHAGQLQFILPKECVAEGDLTKIEFVLEKCKGNDMRWDRVDNPINLAFASIDISCL